MAEDENQRDRDRWIGVYIGVLAVILAICSMGGGNAAKNATLKNIEASNTWAFFQAKNLRRQGLRLQNDELELELQMRPETGEAAREAIARKTASNKELDQKLTTDPASGEGLDELWAKAKAAEVARDRAMLQDPYFDYAEASLQIAIVLASVAIISGGTVLLMASGLLGVIGAFLTFNGFTLTFAIPLIG